MPIDVRGGRHIAALVLTQLWVMLAWVFFRCDSAAQATEVLAAILGLRPHPQGIFCDLQPLTRQHIRRSATDASGASPPLAAAATNDEVCPEPDFPNLA
jgi:hypothetical protein